MRVVIFASQVASFSALFDSSVVTDVVEHTCNNYAQLEPTVFQINRERHKRNLPEPADLPTSTILRRRPLRRHVLKQPERWVPCYDRYLPVSRSLALKLNSCNPPTSSINQGQSDHKVFVLQPL